MASVTPSNVSMRQHNQYEIEQSKQGRFPHKRPLPYRKKGTEQEIHSAPITHSKTDETVVSSVFFFLSGIASDPYFDPDAERSGAIQKAPERTFPITSAACRWAAVVTWA